MNVHKYMTSNPVTIYPEITCSVAFRLMREKNIRRLPVVDKEGYLLGIVTEKDLLYSWPLAAALRSVHEIDERFRKIPVADVMAKEVISITEDCPLEKAACILVDYKIGGLPVTRGHRLVGVITRTDIFRVMMEALGGRAEGLRVTIRLCQDKGELGAITDGIIQLGGRLLGLSTFWGDDPFKQMIMLKLEKADPEDLLLMLEKRIGVQVIDYRKFSDEFERSPSRMNMEEVQMQQVELNVNRLTDST